MKKAKRSHLFTHSSFTRPPKGQVPSLPLFCHRLRKEQSARDTRLVTGRARIQTQAAGPHGQGFYT